MEQVDVIVMGAGAAGLMAAMVAGQRGRRVLVVDHNDAPGRKILISGGGRCNFTNLGATDGNYLSQNPHFAKSALRRYRPADFIALVEKHGIAWHEKTLGQLFCDGSAKQIVAMLMDECAAAGVDFAFGQAADVARDGDGFIATIGARKVRASSLILATGGLSIPKLGATSFAYDLARSWGLKIVEPRPALVPLTLAGDQLLFRELAGVAAPVTARAKSGPAFAEAALFTHRGLSGPAILQASSYWRNGEPVRIDFLPDHANGWLRQAKRDTPNRQLGTLLAERLPERLAGTLAEKLDLAGPLQGQSDKALAQAEERLSGWEFFPSGSEGFAKAEVTVGGISTAELSSKTMEAKKVSGLYPIGEAVDVTGWLGGYNFQWAWASGVAAGQAA
ncbi:NAD(P)/FAD-dependent oxidoreductase [Sphingomicrobium aestuariivivum]|uniref:NAD(P)/FAD-dependent oxidoreductase n=1 Tax=Sphingomicrobium aestuariivivum TaxID=1582356 RepID=UPI001FD64AB5|nr:NAD(P)/FAD-dependent oxidoreductase [Sphingomicrobium aestuariivivum]MCJ8191121.1 NAD(P)/FAD-dependent oxidoreductase [Sphingomicrobium aestuariivivum]